jgi:Protein of unknown function (DUF4238)
MPRDHIVPRFLLARWADPETGKIVVWDRRSGRPPSEVDPVDHSIVDDFNVDRRSDGTVDSWLESELFAGLESQAAGSLTQLEQVRPTMKHIGRLARGGLEPFHLLPRRRTMGLAMFIGAQMVRSPRWRGAIERATCRDMEADMKVGVEEQLAGATDPAEIARLEELLGIRYVAVTTDKAMQIQLSGHLAYKIGTVLYGSFFWSVHRFAAPCLVLGDEPVILASPSVPLGFGSLADIAFEREILSVQRGLERVVEAVIEIVASAKTIILPFGPRHALVLNPIESLCLPGRYDRNEEDAKLFNTWTRASSREWAVWQPGVEPEALDGRELAELVVDAIHTDPSLARAAR